MQTNCLVLLAKLCFHARILMSYIWLPTLDFTLHLLSGRRYQLKGDLTVSTSEHMIIMLLGLIWQEGAYST